VILSGSPLSATTARPRCGIATGFKRRAVEQQQGPAAEGNRLHGWVAEVRHKRGRGLA